MMSSFTLKAISLLGTLLLPSISLAQYPQDFTIQSLQDSYIATQVCEHACNAVLGLRLTAISSDSKEITLEIPVTASHLSMVSLGIDASALEWKEFTLDGRQHHAVSSQGNQIMVAISPGVHSIGIKARLKSDDTRIALLSMPKFFENKTSSSASIKRNADNVFLELDLAPSNKTSDTAKTDTAGLFSPALYKVERQLILGDTWKLKTQVSPLFSSKQSKPGSIKIDLLPGEKLLTNDVMVNDGKVIVDLAQNNYGWESSVLPSEHLKLQATSPEYVQSWQVVSQGNWIYEYAGLSPMESFSKGDSTSIKTWLMWPGQSVQLSLHLPEASPGQLTNVEDFAMASTLGQTAATHHVKAVINSSMGGNYHIKFKSGNAELKKLMVNSKELSPKLHDAMVTLELLTGKNEIMMELYQDHISSWSYSVPSIEFETPVTNASFTVNHGKRWLLLAGAADIKPVILLWGVLASMALFAWLLSQVKVMPLRYGDWLLLLIGLSQSGYFSAIIIVAWFFAFYYRSQSNPLLDPQRTKSFNRFQVLLVVWSLVALSILTSIVAKGLLYQPELFIAGYASYSSHLYWYMQTWHANAQTPWIIYTPLWLYRVLMLLWSGWLAFTLIAWLKWMWQCYSKGGWWLTKPAQTPTQ